MQLWDDINKEGFSFLMTSRLNSDPIKNFFSVLRMHGGSYNRNPSAKAVRLSIRKNLLLNLQNSFHYGNCMPDNDVPLVSGDISQESAALNASLEENLDDDCFDDTEMDNIEELPTLTCSLESCALEYFAGYIAEKCIDKSQCRRCCETFLDIKKFFTRTSNY